MAYIDVLGEHVPPTPRILHRLMHIEFYTTGYQRGCILAGPQLHPGATVIDVGCGPGNFTGLFGTAVGESGVAVGVDASHQMLRRATIDNPGPNMAYLRTDAQNLPFADRSTDDAACLMALYLIEHPSKPSTRSPLCCARAVGPSS